MGARHAPHVAPRSSASEGLASSIRDPRRGFTTSKQLALTPFRSSTNHVNGPSDVTLLGLLLLEDVVTSQIMRRRLSEVWRRRWMSLTTTPASFQGDARDLATCGTGANMTISSTVLADLLHAILRHTCPQSCQLSHKPCIQDKCHLKKTKKVVFFTGYWFCLKCVKEI